MPQRRKDVHGHGRFVLALAFCVASCLFTSTVWADCPGNVIFNPGFEGSNYKSETLGTSLSSNVGEGWTPWSILGNATYNREVEYKVLDISTLPDTYHVHSGRAAQKFFTTWGTHTAGFFQRVKVTPGSKVTFSIWAQIYTGEQDLAVGGHFVSDLEWPKQGERKGPGLYRISVGIDATGATPGGFGAPPSASTVWSKPLTEFDTRTTDANGTPVDAWVQLTLSTIAQGEYVTVYTKGQPEYPVKHNDSFWDDACLVVQSAPTATAKPTTPPTATSVPPTVTPEPTKTPVPPTATPVPPTMTPEPTKTPIPPTATSLPPTVTPAPAQTSVPPTVAAPPTAEPTPLPAVASNTGRWSLYGGIALGVVAVAVVVWLVLRRRG
jgi:hypothetical protein